LILLNVDNSTVRIVITDRIGL